MYTITMSRFTYLLLALFAIQISATAIKIPNPNRRHLAARQNQISCDEYAMLANLTAIGQNSTFRGAFIKASPDGTAKSEAIINNAITKWTSLKLINDTQLNKKCTNLTKVALLEAPKNFTKGIVAQFKISAGVRATGGIGYAVLITTAFVGFAACL
jgi:hypothetical protein